MTAAKMLFFGIAGALLCAALFFYFRPDPVPLRIGYVGSISGKYAAMGTSARNGALLAAEEINENGGVLGRPLELVVMDDGGDPARTEEVFQALYAQGLDIIIGPFTTASATRILSYVNQNGILTIGPATAGENLAKQDDFFIKIFPSTKTFGQKIGELAVQMGLTKMAVMTDHRNKKFGDTMIEGFLPVFERDGRTVTGQVEFFSAANISHADLAEVALKGSPEGVFIISSPIDTALLAQNLKRTDPDVLLFTAPWAIAKELIENGGGAVEGLRFYAPYVSESKAPGYQAFVQVYKNRFSDAHTHVSVFNYEAVKLLAKGLENASSEAPIDVKTALLALDNFDGLQTDFRLDGNGDAGRPLFLHHIQDRKFTPLP
jgi:branched-chain amino acid transport system substrate-binding protein